MTRRLLISLTLAFATLVATAIPATAADTAATNEYKTLQHSDDTSTTYHLNILPDEHGPSVSSRPPQDPLAQRLVEDGLKNYDAKRWLDAKDLLNQALERTKADEHDARAEIISYIAHIQINRQQYAAAETSLRQSMQEARLVKGATPGAFVSLNQNLAIMLMFQQKFAEAEQVMRSNLELLRGRSPDDPNLIEAKRMLSHILAYQGNDKEAEPFARETLKGLRHRYGDKHMDVVIASAKLGNLLHKLGRFVDALPHLERAVAHWPDDSPIEPATHGNALIVLGHTLDTLKRYGESLPYYRRGIEIQKTQIGDHTSTIDAQMAYLVVLGRADDKPEVIRVLTDALASRARLGGPPDGRTAYLISILGTWYFATKDIERGIPHVRRAIAICEHVRCEDTLLAGLQNLRSELPALATANAAEPAIQTGKVDAQITHAVDLARVQDNGETLRVLIDALALKASLGGPADDQTSYLIGLLAMWFANSGEPGRAAEHLRRASALCEHMKCREALVTDLKEVRRRLNLEPIRARQ